ncbi:hypothetical protein BDD43_0220 [Mucilaginibacter gracilis]|uniref:Glycosyl hydrolase family 18 (Putative chitinase) n=1 Tax=Mucilaginibacter gracilis TaxID=423350 RepID=A0A495ITM1_9SPHI|nr:hypothetical protein [Mucilaginibacter gracilis]RKR80125.1 hypothetical protein BDD43_0220 [Mucilaginibacter gracilis]
MKKILVLVSLMLACCGGFAQKSKSAKHRFTVYGFIVYAGYSQNGSNVKASYKQLQQYLLQYGVNTMDLIYEQKVLDYPTGDKKNGIPNIARIDSLSQQALGFKDVLVSLDLEGWNRWDTVKTTARMIETINYFKKVNSKSKVGLYATVPQNTYAYSENINRYDKINKGYAGVAAAVDYFSPSLYNYDADTVNWNKTALYNINACKKYNYPDKPILPYITPEVDNKGVKSMLTYDEMMSHLQTLYKLGANGCLLWTSSGMRYANGQKVYVDVNSGWMKAVKDFIASH